MLDKEPLLFPSRNAFPYNPGVPDKQLWAIGMIAVQWSMTEWFMEVQTLKYVGTDQSLLAEHRKLRNFQQALEFWKRLIELEETEPYRSKYLTLIPVIQSLSSQRDDVIHRLWGGGLEGKSWAAGGEETTEAVLLPNPGEPIKTKSGNGPIPPRWRATFIRLRRLAREIATVNRDLFVIGLVPDAEPVGRCRKDL